MQTQNARRRIQVLPALLIVWNILDIAIHVALNRVEPLRITGNIVGIAAALIVLLGLARAYAPYVLGGAAAAVVCVNLLQSFQHGFMLPMLVFVGVSVFLLLRWAQTKALALNAETENAGSPFYLRCWVALPVTLAGVAMVAFVGQPADSGIIAQAHNGALAGADYWSDKPSILSAGLGFDNIIGIAELTENAVREAGGSWHATVTCASGEQPVARHRTSAVTPALIARFYKGFADYDDGLPIVFSWPVATETVDVTDFQFTLNTGKVVFAHSVGMFPNWELNERNTVVVFGDFGNRGLRSEVDAVYPVRLDIVKDNTPLLLIGPGGQEFNAVGLSWETNATPYDAGPKLVGAKLNFVRNSSRGEGGIRLLEAQSGYLPNDEFALYNEGDFRIRVLTTGGFSPDGVTGVRPDMYQDFFRIHVKGQDGKTVLLEKVGVDYAVAGGTLRVVGLSDLGQRKNPAAGIYYDDCYAEDRDNYIDIILAGDEAAARNVTFVEIPALQGGYRAFYNPGGPGPTPFQSVRYTAPGPPDMEPVIIALNDPMRVDRKAPK